MYTTQQVRVMWSGSYSPGFPVTNGAKQGGVLSPICFVFILMFCSLSPRKGRPTECFVSGCLLAYANDLLLLALTAMAMRRMLSICNYFAIEFFYVIQC